MSPAASFSLLKWFCLNPCQWEWFPSEVKLLLSLFNLASCVFSQYRRALSCDDWSHLLLSQDGACRVNRNFSILVWNLEVVEREIQEAAVAQQVDIWLWASVLWQLCSNINRQVVSASTSYSSSSSSSLICGSAVNLRHVQTCPLHSGCNRESFLPLWAAQPGSTKSCQAVSLSLV